jgi:hypothetical protein
VLESDDGISFKISNISITNTVLGALYQHPTKVREEEAAVSTIGIFISVCPSEFAKKKKKKKKKKKLEIGKTSKSWSHIFFKKNDIPVMSTMSSGPPVNGTFNSTGTS